MPASWVEHRAEVLEKVTPMKSHAVIRVDEFPILLNNAVIRVG